MMKTNKAKNILKKIILINIICIECIFIKFVFSNFDTTETISNSKSEYRILVDVEESKLYLFENEILIKTYSCSGGKWSTPSPIGTWTVISKAKWGEGFGGSWMGLNVPWGKFGIHGTLEPNSLGWASSHGCIRMKNSEVAELYKIIPIGTKVIIVDGVYGDFGRGFRTLKSGMYGSDVMQIQMKLKELGYFKGIPNGKFGIETEKAVQNFCKSENLYSTKIITPALTEKLGFILMD